MLARMGAEPPGPQRGQAEGPGFSLPQREEGHGFETSTPIGFLFLGKCSCSSWESI